MTRQRWLIALLSLGAVGLIGFAAQLVRSSMRDEAGSMTLVKPLACAACGHRYEASIARGPVACPKCSQNAVWPAVQCMKCGTVVACDKDRFRREGREPYCPQCNSVQMMTIQAGTPVPPPGSS